MKYLVTILTSSNLELLKISYESVLNQKNEYIQDWNALQFFTSEYMTFDAIFNATLMQLLY